ncbi:MAG: DUF1573 domain-containing protein [Armatimonadetes bacterium]|nr:DUF1573 domain-containing protein [Armatimonadota bacterium]
MTAFLFAVALVAQEAAPPIPSGSSPEFQATAYKVEKLLADGQFDQAEKLLQKLPSNEVTISWDDRKVPDLLKSPFAAGRDAAMDDWMKAVPELQVKVAQQGAIKLSFTETLPPGEDSTAPAGAVYFLSDDPADPRVEGVIAIKRETPPVNCDPRNVQNEVGYSIGAYLGLAKLPRPVGYMGRYDTSTRLELRMGKNDIELARKNLAFVKALRDACAKKEKLAVTKPEVFVNATELTKESASQGDPLAFTVEVSNRGNAPLQLRGMPDCGCIHIMVPATVEPGMTGLVQVLVDTSNVWGKFDKAFVIFTNDPDQPVRRIGIKAKVVPPGRFVRTEPGTTIIAQQDGIKEIFYLVMDPAKTISITGINLNGIKGVIDYEPWQGTLADPEMGEGPLPRKGFKVTMLASPTEKQGRIPITLVAKTDSKDTPTLTQAFYIQWGIVASPDQLYFGEILQKDTIGYFFISRPGKPFKVTGVSSDSPYVKATVEPFRDGDYRIAVTILKSVPFGRLDCNVIVKTDDPKDKQISIPVFALVK